MPKIPQCLNIVVFMSRPSTFRMCRRLVFNPTTTVLVVHVFAPTARSVGQHLHSFAENRGVRTD